MQAGTSRTSLNRATEIKETEAQSRFVNERVSQIETYFGDLCTEFISYTRRTAKLRNNGDELSKILLNYSVNEKINRTSANTLKKFAQLLSTIEDYRHAEVDRLFAKVITPLSTYGDEVKRVRSNIKAETAARKKEVTQIKRLGREPTRAIEERLLTATMDATRSADALERHVIQFEAKKIKGLKPEAFSDPDWTELHAFFLLKDILSDFVHIEMLWHAKALETLTEAFNVVQAMQEEADLADFRNTLLRSGTVASLSGGDYFPTSQAALDTSKSRSVPVLNTSPPVNRIRQPIASASQGRQAEGDNRKRDNFKKTVSDIYSQLTNEFQGNSRGHNKSSDNSYTKDEDNSDENSEEESDGDNGDDDEDSDDTEENDEDEDEDEDSEDSEVTEEDEESEESEESGESSSHQQKQVHRPLPIKSATPLKSALKQSPKHPVRAR